jgi:hypothetical protein
MESDNMENGNEMEVAKVEIAIDAQLNRNRKE